MDILWTSKRNPCALQHWKEKFKKLGKIWKKKRNKPHLITIASNTLTILAHLEENPHASIVIIETGLPKSSVH